MPHPTALRRVSTLVVATLFAVVFVCSGIASAHAPVTPGETAVSGHTGVAKAVVRSAPHTTKAQQPQATQHLDLVSTGPVGVAFVPAAAVTTVAAEPAARSGAATLPASDRAPPAR